MRPEIRAAPPAKKLFAGLLGLRLTESLLQFFRFTFRNGIELQGKPDPIEVDHTPRKRKCAVANGDRHRRLFAGLGHRETLHKTAARAEIADSHLSRARARVPLSNEQLIHSNVLPAVFYHRCFLRHGA
jgi:hypothetical protein